MAEKADWHMSKQELLDCLNDDKMFEDMLAFGLKPVSPPVDFCDRVMSEIAASSEPKPAKIVSFPWRRFAAGLGTCAAAFALFIGVSGGISENNSNVVLNNKPLQVAQEVEPALSAPTAKTEAKQADSTPAATSVSATQQTTDKNVGQTADSTEIVDDTTTVDAPLAVKSDELILPRAAYGTTTEGNLSTRLLASVEGNNLYQPGFAGKRAVFYTADSDNVYSWWVDLNNPSLPEVSTVAAKSDTANTAAALINTTSTVDATTIVASPDKTMLAQNSADGIWISLLDGDVFKLTDEGKGNLLAWSPDSSKLVFTNADGALLVGYPLERRIYSLTDSNVLDVCWNSDSKTLLYISNTGGSDALYIVETY